MKRTHSQSPTIKHEVGQEPLAKRVKQEGAGAAAALRPVLVAVKQEIGAHSGQPAVHPSGVLPAQVQRGKPVGLVTLQQFDELAQMVQSQAQQIKSLQKQNQEIPRLKHKINEVDQTSIRIKEMPEGTYRGLLVNGKATGYGIF